MGVGAGQGHLGFPKGVLFRQALLHSGGILGVDADKV